MFRFVPITLALAVSFAAPIAALADPLIPLKRSLVTQDADLPGGDIASIFDTTIEACERACTTNQRCEAFTFNGRNNSCFLKSGHGEPSYFEGAQSGVMISTAPAAEALAKTRRAELDFLQDWEFSQATEMAASLGRTHTTGPWSVEDHLSEAQSRESQGDWVMATAHTGAALNREDRADLWLEYARRSIKAAETNSNDRSWFQERAQHAAINAYLRADNAAQRHSILVTLGEALELRGRGRDMVQALRLAQSLQNRDDTARLLEVASGKYGFRISDNSVQADLARPRICVEFTEDLQQSGVDYADFVQLTEPGLAVELGGQRKLCVTGMRHGARYALTFREGLPAADGQSLAQNVEITQYVRDRSPSVSFPGRGYVLPKGEGAALPVQTVNTDRLDLTLYKVTDRNILRAVQNDYFGTPIYEYDEAHFSQELGEKIWNGSASVSREVNQDVTTRLPMAEALKDQPSGIYALKAAVPGLDPYEIGPAWQWFIVSDLGLTSLSAKDGLHVFVRSLGTAKAKAGTEVELLNRANAVLGRTTTDAEGYARFDAGLVRGTGAAAPAVLIARDGPEDLAFLSLTDPEFDLSDRGVSGREAAAAVDVFATTDRGAYRAGETVYVTALARDSTAKAIENLPLTAVLKRPDGVEYARNLVKDSGAGGHVFELPIAASAPRGVWRLELFADVKAEPLAQKTFLVEDFLPERIDFTLETEGGELIDAASGAVALVLDAKYLFGAPAGGLQIEGETLLRAAKGLDAFPGFVFGREDQPFNTVYESLPAATTLEDGKAYLDAALPVVEDPGRPLVAGFVLRVAEGSGRPVERRIERPVAPLAPLIGVKPMFDGVVAEGSDARFQLIGVGQDLAATAMQVKWQLTRIETDYQWYQSYGNWYWEPVVNRTPVAEGELALGDSPGEIAAKVGWGNYELRVDRLDGKGATTTTKFWAGWYAPADASATPDTLALSLDKPDYKAGDTAELRIVPRAAGTALITVLSNRLVAMKAVDLKEGENVIPLEVTDEWGAGVYVTASVLRPMEVAAGRNPSRALGLAYAKIDPGSRALTTKLELPESADPRGPLPVAVKVEGILPGETGYVTIAAVDEGILNLTRFEAPDPQDHFFGQRRLGVGIRDIYGRLIDGLNGAEGTVRSGGDAGAQARLQAPPPTEELVAYFSGPIAVDADGYARASFDLPSFNGAVKVMAVAWSQSGIGQADQSVLVRDPVVVTASLPRFMAPGDESRVLLEIVHASGPAGKMALQAEAAGVTLGAMPADVTLAEKGKAVVELPITARDVGIHELAITLTTSEGKALLKKVTLPVMVNDPEVALVSRVDLAKGESFNFDSAVLDEFHPGTGKAVMAVGPLAQLNAPGLLAGLDRYPYGCTEQMTSRAMPLLYFDQLAQVMELKGAENIQARVNAAVVEILGNQGAEGGFGLWGPDSGDVWLDAYVADFLSRARAQGYQVPDLAFRNALANLRNQVNYAPDFDAKTNGGGEALAYALMVLAREGAAAIGDLRYYADVKGDDFATPLAQAQLGAALASYGDQTRADAMFRKAGAALNALPAKESEQIWRADFGSHYRDTAGVLALAVEAGSNAIDRGALTSRLGGRDGGLSTQEAVWTLMASHALIDRPDASGISINGAAATGPLVKVLDSENAAPVEVTNQGENTVLTLTRYGVPLVGAPAGGNGYAIERAYYTMDGSPRTLDEVSTGERLVAVLTIRPFGRSDGRLIVADPLPAGFEIDNPNLISGGSLSQLGWLDGLEGTDVSGETKHSEFRQDRFIAQVDWSDSNSFRLAYIVRAISPGRFHHPAASVEDMYRPDFRAQSETGALVIAR